MRKFFTAENGAESGGGTGIINHEKAQDHIKERISEVKPDKSSDQEKEVEMNLSPDNNLGHNPENTLKGQIIASKYGEEVHERLIDFRTRIDSFYLTCKGLADLQFMSSRELALAITAFQNARQHTGKLLSERGAPHPYPKNDGTAERPNQGQEIDGIKFTATMDMALNKENAVAAFKKLRDLVEDVIVEFSIFGNNMAMSSYIEVVSSTSVMKGLLDGKMWLGEAQAIMAAK